MPDAVIVATGRTPIGRAFKGSLVDLRPDDLTALVVRDGPGQVPRSRPAERRGPARRLRPAGRRVRLQRRARRGAPRRARRRPGRHGQPLLLVARSRRSAWPRTRSARARATSSSPRASRPSRATRSGASDTGKAHQRTLRARPMARTATRRARRPSPGRPSPGPARHLHRDGPDRRERRGVREGDRARDGRVRAAQPGAAPSSTRRTGSSSARSSRSRCPTARS